MRLGVLGVALLLLALVLFVTTLLGRLTQRIRGSGGSNQTAYTGGSGGGDGGGASSGGGSAGGGDGASFGDGSAGGGGAGGRY